jgi:hypothetical protein
MHIYEVRPHEDRRGFDLLSELPPFGLVVRRAECGQQRNRLRKVFSRLHDAVIRVYDS